MRPATQKVLDLIKEHGELTLDDLEDELGYHRSNIRKYICELKAERKVYVKSWVWDKPRGNWIAVYAHAHRRDLQDAPIPKRDYHAARKEMRERAVLRVPSIFHMADVMRDHYRIIFLEYDRENQPVS